MKMKSILFIVKLLSDEFMHDNLKASIGAPFEKSTKIKYAV